MKIRTDFLSLDAEGAGGLPFGAQAGQRFNEILSLDAEGAGGLPFGTQTGQRSGEILSLDADGTSELPFGTQTGQRSGELRNCAEINLPDCVGYFFESAEQKSGA